MIEPAPVRLFTGLGREETSVILAAATKRAFKASEIITSADQVPSHLFLLRSGSVNIHIVTNDGQEVLLKQLAPEDVFGVASLLSEPMLSIGTAQAIRDSQLFMWEQRVARQLARAYPRLGENALRTALRHFALLAERHIGLLMDPAEERLARVLIGLASRVGCTLKVGIQIDIKNEDLASLADVSRFTASRLLRQWQRKGAVEKFRGKVLLLHPERMITAA